jgi:uncharacterized protein (DUF1501 family)
MNRSRRSFLTNASLLAAGNAAGLKPFGMLNSLAQTSANYKALVCVFLFGGNDANNMVIPFDAAGYMNYSTIRGPLALAQNTLLPLTPTPAFALHPSMPNLQALYNSGNMALLTNVGTLLQPTTKLQYQSSLVAPPTNLFSHPDQQLEWQNQVQNAAGSTGWAGRIADTLNTQYNANALVPMIASLGGDSLFCNGASTGPVSLGSGGPSTAGCSDGTYCTGRQQTAQQLSTFASGVSLVQADNSITNNAFTYNTVLANALGSATALKTVFPTTQPFGAQLAEVAKLINVRSALGVSRQIFFVGAGNFDTHSSQLTLQSTLLSQVDAGLGAFYQALQEMNLTSQVTAFTCSDFARTFQPNSTSGTDHGWGNHHIVLGGAVKGGQMYGSFPTLTLGGASDVGSNGRWLPTTASAQYASTLAQWFGLPVANLQYVLPYINNFTVNNLQFMGS